MSLRTELVQFGDSKTAYQSLDGGPKPLVGIVVESVSPKMPAHKPITGRIQASAPLCSPKIKACFHRNKGTLATAASVAFGLGLMVSSYLVYFNK